MSRALFIRVKSNSTGHEFDVREDSILLARGAVAHVKPKLYPPSRYPRPPKYRRVLPGRPASEQAPTLPGGDNQSPDLVEG